VTVVDADTPHVTLRSPPTPRSACAQVVVLKGRPEPCCISPERDEAAVCARFENPALACRGPGRTSCRRHDRRAASRRACRWTPFAVAARLGVDYLHGLAGGLVRAAPRRSPACWPRTSAREYPVASGNPRRDRGTCATSARTSRVRRPQRGGAGGSSDPTPIGPLPPASRTSHRRMAVPGVHRSRGRLAVGRDSPPCRCMASVACRVDPRLASCATSRSLRRWHGDPDNAVSVHPVVQGRRLRPRRRAGRPRAYEDAGAKRLCVATFDEGIELRRRGIRLPMPRPLSRPALGWRREAADSAYQPHGRRIGGSWPPGRSKRGASSDGEAGGRRRLPATPKSSVTVSGLRTGGSGSATSPRRPRRSGPLRAWASPGSGRTIGEPRRSRLAPRPNSTAFGEAEAVLGSASPGLGDRRTRRLRQDAPPTRRERRPFYGETGPREVGLIRPRALDVRRPARTDSSPHPGPVGTCRRPQRLGDEPSTRGRSGSSIWHGLAWGVLSYGAGFRHGPPQPDRQPCPSATPAATQTRAERPRRGSSCGAIRWPIVGAIAHDGRDLWPTSTRRPRSARRRGTTSSCCWVIRRTRNPHGR
jgi:hypothetical protein